MFFLECVVGFTALALLDALGLGWVGLGWVGLGWVGLGWVGLGWVGLGWVGLGWVVHLRSGAVLCLCCSAALCFAVCAANGGFH